jgi:Sec-independent protein translocase protein TatA
MANRPGCSAEHSCFMLARAAAGAIGATKCEAASVKNVDDDDDADNDDDGEEHDGGKHEKIDDE